MTSSYYILGTTLVARGALTILHIVLYYYISSTDPKTCTRVMRINGEKINIYFEKERFLYDARTCKLDHDN